MTSYTKIYNIANEFNPFDSQSIAYLNAPAMPQVGDLWYDTAEHKIKIYSGEKWMVVDGKKAPVTPIDVAGIYHNADLGLISLSSDGESWITIADKNLGATEVQNSENITSTNGGKLYQRGNNYGFPRDASGISTSSSAVNASTYGPGNYYISSTFITVPSNTWDSSNNKNLRGGETGTYEAMQGPCTEGWHIPSIPDVNSLISILQNLGLLSSTSGSNTLTQAQYNVLCSSLKLYARKRISADDASLITDNGIQVVTSQIRGSAMGYGLLYISYTNSNYYWHKPSDTDVYNSSTGYGVPIRPFKNEAVQPDSSREVLYEPGTTPDLKSFDEITRMGAPAKTELNTYPTEYYAKFSSENHLYYDGSVYYLSEDGTYGKSLLVMPKYNPSTQTWN